MNQDIDGVNIEEGTIEFDLDFPVDMSKDGKVIKGKTILFKQPNRKTAPLFENLVGMYQDSMSNVLTYIDKIAPEQAEKLKDKVADGPKGVEVDSEAELNKITLKSIMEEVESNSGVINGLGLDFEKAYKIFEKMMLAASKMATCFIEGIGMKEVIYERIDYRDLKKMLLVYITFFSKPVKSDTGIDSGQQSDSLKGATEL